MAKTFTKTIQIPNQPDLTFTVIAEHEWQGHFKLAMLLEQAEDIFCAAKVEALNASKISMKEG